ncbi:MAG: domain S-box protein [Nocardioides sp.]|jgi:PAS domain S-box-containing protein|uniref:sensor histidine kinase n=1 Tax=Nocardioides sp. TaxID=35761 RepID=UPI00261B7C6D|nr:ATP-binding protein [Nocardioides sp.]MCW2832155.1 domain S-box protein [Nocardioides sp.]
MTGTVLFAVSVAIYAGLPMLMAIRHSSFQLLMLYCHTAAVLTMGGILGAVYILPVGGEVTLLAGQVSYGGFMFATLVTAVVGRDVQVVRNIIVLVLSVNAVVFLMFQTTHVALANQNVPSPLGVDPAVFDKSLAVVLLGGTLIILELLTLLAVLEVAKRRLAGRWLPLVTLISFVAILTLDGVLFPALVLRPSSGLGDLIASSVLSKLVLAAAFAVPLALFLGLYPRLVQRFEDTPIELTRLVPGRRTGVEQQLKEREAELAARTAEAGRATATVDRILDAATNTMLVATDSDFRITHFSVGAQTLLGYSGSDVLGRSISDFGQSEQLVHHAEQLGVPGRPPDVVAALAREGARRDWAVLTKSGETKVLSLSFTEIRDDHLLIGYLFAGEDMTDRLRAEEALSQALRREHDAVDRLEDADRVKDEVVSTISHELRTPLASIRGYSEVLVEGDLGELNVRQTEALGKVLRNAGRLSSLVDDLLHLDRSSTRGPGDARVATDLVGIVRDAHDGLIQLARRRDLELGLDVPSYPVLVLGDPADLERVVLNLGDNAVKFTPDGGSVTVSVDRHGDQAVIRVTDTGIGIAGAEQHKVLERFYRSSQAYHHAIPGTGLGLAVVNDIVSEHRGTLTVSSTPGSGTTVTVLLPIFESELLDPA